MKRAGRFPADKKEACGERETFSFIGKGTARAADPRRQARTESILRAAGIVISMRGARVARSMMFHTTRHGDAPGVHIYTDGGRVKCKRYFPTGAPSRGGEGAAFIPTKTQIF